MSFIGESRAFTGSDEREFSEQPQVDYSVCECCQQDDGTVRFRGWDIGRLCDTCAATQAANEANGLLTEVMNGNSD